MTYSVNKDLYTASGSTADKNALWASYAPMIRREALRLRVRLPASVELDDLIQAGAMGLLNAIDNFDPAAGASFKTHVLQRIRWAMLDELRESDWVPRSVRRNARSVAAAIQKIEQRNGTGASEQEIADEMGISLDEYHKILSDSDASQLFSLEELAEVRGETPELEQDEQRSLDPMSQLMDGELRNRVIDAILKLPEREQLILNLYYQQELNLKEIGAVINVSESRVCQLHSQAVNRLRTRLSLN